MKDERKPKAQLIRELTDLRCRVADLEAAEGERKQGEQERVRLERLCALEEMADGVAHNFNNILVGILGHAQLIQMKTSDLEIDQDCARIVESALRAKELVRRLNLSVRGEQEEVGPVEVNEVVLEAVEASQPRWKDEPEAKGISIDLVTELADVPSIRGTRSGLYDSLINLLFNAVDAMPEGGTITLSTAAADGSVRLTVSDTGVGMNEQTRRRVFEPFFTTKTDVGTGLGLSTVYGTLTRWGSQIEVESAPGSGTTCTLQFPVWSEANAEGGREDGEGVRQVRRGRILVAEDDRVVRTILSRLLSDVHEVEMAVDGQEALEMFAPGSTDVALIDLGMPEVSGDRVAQEMRKADPAVATVLITGWELNPEDPRLSAFDFLLQKPFKDIQTVQDKVAQAIELRDSRMKGGKATPEKHR